MDLSLRTYVNGWKAIYLTDVTCINEVGCQMCPCQHCRCIQQQLPMI